MSTLLLSVYEKKGVVKQDKNAAQFGLLDNVNYWAESDISISHNNKNF
ncbi:hypothetical protein [Pasteurella oralis]|nr:hypothetical protein [Pasteurella oralis]